MAIHTSLPIYKVAYELLNLMVQLVKDMPRSVKPFIGTQAFQLCTGIVTLIRSANVDQDKRPHLDRLLERLSETELLLRICQDNRYISRGHYARAIDLTTSIGKQASGWRSYAASPVT